MEPNSLLNSDLQIELSISIQTNPYFFQHTSPSGSLTLELLRDRPRRGSSRYPGVCCDLLGARPRDGDGEIRGFDWIRVVARCSHRASRSSSSAHSFGICGRSAGTLTEAVLPLRDRDRDRDRGEWMCSRFERPRSLLSEDREERRKKAARRGERASSSSATAEGASSSCVNVSVRMNLMSGAGWVSFFLPRIGIFACFLSSPSDDCMPDLSEQSALVFLVVESMFKELCQRSDPVPWINSGIQRSFDKFRTS